jgi:Tfp pilus assembly protein PilF
LTGGVADAYSDHIALATEKLDAATLISIWRSRLHRLREAHVWHGVAMSAKNDKTRARQDFDRALTIDPNFWFAHGMSGLARQEAGEDDAALAELARAIELGMPHRGEYFVRETRYRRQTELTRRGVAYTRKMPVELALVNDQLTLYRLARAQIFLKRGERESGIIESQQAIQLASNSSAVRLRLIGTLAALGQCEEANRQAEAFNEFARMLVMAGMADKCPAPPKQ